MKTLTRSIGYLHILAIVFFSSNVNAQLTVDENVTAVDLTNTISGGGVSISNVTINCSSGAYGTFDASSSNVGIGSGILLTTGLANTPLNSCVYSLSVYDSASDGWACGFIEVYLDGLLAGSYADNSTWGSTSYNILVQDGQTIELVYVTAGGPGCDEAEHSFEFMDAGFNIIANVGTWGSGGPIPAGSQYTGVINCASGGGFGMGAFGAVGPNSGDLASWPWNTIINDPDLLTLDPQATNDACILEFDIMPTCDTLKIDYVFASEEYPNFVNSVNDVFGFFLTGPNPAGGAYAAQNIATLPGTGTPVTINTVNNGTANAGPCTNCSYYINNGWGDDCMMTPGLAHCTDSSLIRYNGLTVPLTAQAPVTPCATYHMKIAVADVMDHAYDSGVFLAYAGLNCPNGNTVVVNNIQDTIIEGCQDAVFEIIRVGDTSVTFDINFQYLGTAIEGTDYPTQPASVTYAIGDTSQTFTIPGILDGVTEGAETVTVVVTYTLCSGSISSDTIELTIIDEPILTFATVDEDCGVCNGTATVSMSPSSPLATFAWDAAAANQITQTAGNLCSGSYTVTVTDTNGCAATGTAPISSSGGPPIDVIPTAESCLGFGDGSIAINITGVGPFDMYLDGVLAPVSPVTNLAPGTYAISVTEPVSGCQTDTIVTVIAGPCCLAATATSTDESCAGACDGTGTVATTTNAAGTITYNWLDVAGTPIGQTTITATGLCAGTYQVEVSDSLCTVTELVVIGSPTAIIASASNDTIICIGGTASLNATAVNGLAPYTFLWSNGVATASFNVTTLVDSSLSVVVTDANGCISNIDTTNIFVNPPIVLTVTGGTTICAGSSTDLTATAIGGDGGPYTFTWSDQTGIIGNGSPFTVTPGDTTQYYVTVNDGCETPIMVDSATVNTEAAPIVLFTADTVGGCVPVPVNFTNTTNVASVGTTFWDLGDGTTSTELVYVNHVYTGVGCFDVSLTVTSLNGCTSTVVVPGMVCSYAVPAASFTANPQPTNLLNPTVNFTNTSTDGDTYLWSFGTLGSSTDPNPSFTFPSDEPGEYDVCLFVTTVNGCSQLNCQKIVINSYLTVYVPNAFTPNGDGVNEVFIPVLDGYDATDYEFMIFDRWGEQLWTSDTPNEGWDGTYKDGTIVPDGVYVWKLKAKDIGTKEESIYKGHVTILR